MAILIIWLLLAIIPAVAADKRGRNAGIWFLIALVISPLIALVLVLCSRDLRMERLLASRETPGPASLRDTDPRKLRHSSWLGGRTSTVVIDRAPKLFEPDGVLAGIPYRVTADGSVEAVMQGTTVKFRDIDRFKRSINAPPPAA
ncbi:hypothetical protein ACVI1L_006796 [Bradyrhizobium sp. USDA 4516]